VDHFQLSYHTLLPPSIKLVNYITSKSCELESSPIQFNPLKNKANSGYSKYTASSFLQFIQTMGGNGHYQKLGPRKISTDLSVSFFY